MSNAPSLKSGLLPKTGSGPASSSSGSGGGGTPANAYLNGGNSFGALATIGTNDAYDLVIEAWGAPALSFNHSSLTGTFAGPVVVSTGVLSLGTAGSNNSSAVFYNAGNTKFIQLLSGVTATSYNLTLPTAPASGALNVLTANTVSALSFTDANSSSSGFLLQGGNSFGAGAILGTIDNNSLTVKTHNTTALTLDTSQNAAFAGTVAARTSLLLSGATSGALTVSVPATVTSYAVTWPSAQGAAGTALTNNGSGALSWTSPSAGYSSAPAFAVISTPIAVSALTSVPQNLLTLSITTPASGNWGVNVSYVVSADTFSTADAVYFTASCVFGSCAQTGVDSPNLAVVHTFSASGPMLNYGGGSKPASVLSLGPSTTLTINLQTYAFYTSGAGQSFNVTFGDSTAGSTFPGSTQLSATLIPL